MSDDQSEFGIVLANAPRLEKAFGRKLAACITLVSLYFARRQSGFSGLLASTILTIGMAFLTWMRFGR